MVLPDLVDGAVAGDGGETAAKDWAETPACLNVRPNSI